MVICKVSHEGVGPQAPQKHLLLGKQHSDDVSSVITTIKRTVLLFDLHVSTGYPEAETKCFPDYITTCYITSS